jgi:flavorubredoxin
MHFRQFLHQNHFTLMMNHKPLKWLVAVFNAYGWKGCWIDMLQDFNFKIIDQDLSIPM